MHPFTDTKVSGMRRFIELLNFMKKSCLILLLLISLLFTACQEGNIDLDNSGEEAVGGIHRWCGV